MDASEYALQVTRPLSVAGFFPRTGTGYFTPEMGQRTAYMPSNAQTSATTASRGLVAVNSMYKTKTCRNFSLTGRCRYGDKCIFVHRAEDMRNSSLMNRNSSGTGVCKYSWRMCPYGERCFYTHTGLEDYKVKRENSVINIQPGGSGDCDPKCKTPLCNSWTGVKSCSYCSKCSFAHGKADLRSAPAPALVSESGNARVAPKAALVKYALPNEGRKRTALKQKLSPRVCLLKWRKFNKLVGIYADWIDE